MSSTSTAASSAAFTFRQFREYLASLLSVGEKQSISLALHEEFLSLYSQLERERALFSLLKTETARNRRLLFLFQKDLLPGITGEILNTKDQRENCHIQPVSRKVKQLSWLFVVLLDVGMLFYIFLFAISQDSHRQSAWGRSLGMYFLLDMFLISSGMVLFFHILLPSLVMRDVVQIRGKMRETVSQYFRQISSKQKEISKKQQRRTAAKERYQPAAASDEDEDEDEDENVPLHLAKSREEEKKGNAANCQEDDDDDQEDEGAPSFNAAKYLFLSYRLAEEFPDLKASKVIRQFSSPWPKQSYQRTIDVKKDYNYTYTAISQSAYIIVVFFLTNLLAAPLAVQDMILAMCGAIVMGYTLLLHIQLFHIFPVLVIVPTISIACLGYLGYLWYCRYLAAKQPKTEEGVLEAGKVSRKAAANVDPIPQQETPPIAPPTRRLPVRSEQSRRASLAYGIQLSSQIQSTLRAEDGRSGPSNGSISENQLVAVHENRGDTSDEENEDHQYEPGVREESYQAESDTFRSNNSPGRSEGRHDDSDDNLSYPAPAYDIDEDDLDGSLNSSDFMLSDDDISVSLTGPDPRSTENQSNDRYDGLSDEFDRTYSQ